MRLSVLFGAGLVHLWELDLDAAERMFVECCVVGAENLLGPSETRLAQVHVLRGDGSKAIDLLGEHLEAQLRDLRYWSELGLLLATRAAALALVGEGSSARRIAEEATRWSELGGNAGASWFSRSVLHFTFWRWPLATGSPSHSFDGLGATARLMTAVDPNTWTLSGADRQAARALLEGYDDRTHVNFGSLGSLWRRAVLAIAVGDASQLESARSSLVALQTRGVMAAPAVPLSTEELCRRLVR